MNNHCMKGDGDVTGANKTLLEYKQAASPIPDVNLSWPLYAAGLENIGKAGAPVGLPMPKIRDDQLLVRVDAVGLCFSDIKLITQGSSHPRIYGRDLQKEPAIPGHEATMTVVGVGRELADQYKVGERYLVQADVFYQGKSMAFGYVLPGALQQYTVIGPEILQGDEGSYLLPLGEKDGYAEVALAEPWACVVASYRITRREALLPGGTALLVITDNAQGPYTLGGAFSPEGRPQQVVVLGPAGPSRQTLLEELGELAMVVNSAQSLGELSQSFTAARGFDDIIFLGTPSPEMVEDAVGVLAVRGVMAILADLAMGRDVLIDIGRIHYDGHIYTGARTKSVAQAYQANRMVELKPGGNAWIIGAGGPMGQMHTQMAAEDPDGPALIVATENSLQRMEELEVRFGPRAKKRGATLLAYNPPQHGPEGLDEEMKDATGGEPFDDIVVMAPSAAVVEDSVRWLGHNGLLNIFAGVPRGTMVRLNLSKVYMEGQRWVGSSGSSLADLRFTLEKIQTRTLQTDSTVAAIAGLNAAKEGLQAVQDGSFPGKVVVWPQLPSLPLIPLPELAKYLPSVAAKLSKEGYWTKEAEDELLSSQLAQN